ncbi:MAG TPA: glycosyltransferase family 2 protein, partial [Puia sp.]|nr:glycosyltransferase family 2 protein [Puia sp.]
MVKLLYFIFLFVQLILAIYLIIPFLSLLLYGLIRLFRIKSPVDLKPVLIDKDFDFGIIITAHQETEFIPPLVDSILKQGYKHFKAYVVADDCEGETLQFEDERIVILKPETALHSKIKSIHFALEQFVRKHDVVIIFDSDNLVHPAFLSVMNRYFQRGYRVVQADFKPKNVDSNYARMDAIGDMFNFFIEREVRMRLGLSAAIWGSGIAFDYDLYKGISYKDNLGGVDKKLQSHFVLQVDRIAFAPEAILFDEKIASGKSLENQRTRWIHSYFKYFKDSFLVFKKGIVRYNFNLVFFGFVLMRPPLFIVLGCSVLVTTADYFISMPVFILWLGIWLSFILSFIAIVAIKGRDFRFIKTIVFIPLFVFRQMLALLKVDRAKKSFIKTK